MSAALSASKAAQLLRSVTTGSETGPNVCQTQLLGHTHIGITATVYVRVRPRLQCEVMTALENALDRP